MKREIDLAKGWVLKADSDGPYDTAYFHAQQAAEKYLKAMLAFKGQAIPRTHDLEELQLLCIPLLEHPDFQDLSLEELSDYAVSVRYDFEFWPDKNTAKEALQITKIVRSLVVAEIC